MSTFISEEDLRKRYKKLSLYNWTMYTMILGIVLMATAAFVFIWSTLGLSLKIFFTGFGLAILAGAFLRFLDHCFETRVLPSFKKFMETGTQEEKSKFAKEVEKALRNKK